MEERDRRLRDWLQADSALRKREPYDCHGCGRRLWRDGHGDVWAAPTWVPGHDVQQPLMTCPHSSCGELVPHDWREIRAARQRELVEDGPVPKHVSEVLAPALELFRAASEAAA